MKKTFQGVIKGLCMTTTQFEYMKHKGTKVANVQAKQPALPEIVSTKSICFGQGFKNCSCRSIFF